MNSSVVSELPNSLGGTLPLDMEKTEICWTAATGYGYVKRLIKDLRDTGLHSYLGTLGSATSNSVGHGCTQSMRT